MGRHERACASVRVCELISVAVSVSVSENCAGIARTSCQQSDACTQLVAQPSKRQAALCFLTCISEALRRGSLQEMYERLLNSGYLLRSYVGMSQKTKKLFWGIRVSQTGGHMMWSCITPASTNLCQASMLHVLADNCNRSGSHAVAARYRTCSGK